MYRIKLTKLSDDYFKGHHPNMIFEGHKESGIVNVLPVIGERFYVGSFSTSMVEEILKQSEKEIIFKTVYSTYKLEFENV